MKKIIIFLTIGLLVANCANAQQIKRQTLSSSGTQKAIAPYRVSWTAGSCPGCSVLHPTTPTGQGYVRQGFQQPPGNGNPTGCPSLSSNFDIMPVTSNACGTKFDFMYIGSTVPNMVVVWDFGPGAVPQQSTDLNPLGVFYTTTGTKAISLKVSVNNAAGQPCTSTSAKLVTILQNQISSASATVRVTDVKCKNDKTGAIALTPTGTGSMTYKWSNGATDRKSVV